MPGYYKIKHILLIMAICFIGGCGTGRQDTADNITNQNTVNTKVTDEAMPTVTKVLTDDTEIADEAKLKNAIAYINDKKYPQAIGLLSQIKDDVQAENLLKQLRYIISGDYIANLGSGIAAIDNKGKVKIVIDDSLYKYYRYDEVSEWTDIKRLSFAGSRLDALDKGGNIHSTIDTDSSYLYVADQLKSYTDLEIISTNYNNYALLSGTGNIYTYSEIYSDVLELYKDYISSWNDIVDVVSGDLRIAALKSDGTVYIADYNKYVNPLYGYLYDEIADWTDIVAISAGPTGSIAGLKSDGTVVVSTSYYINMATYISFDVSDWKDVIAISKSNTTLLGLKRDGTVVATGDNSQKQLEVSDWTDIVAVAAGNWISIGLKADGTLVVAGKTESGTTLDVSGVKDLYVPIVTY